MNSVAKYFTNLFRNKLAKLEEITKPIEIDEVTALMRYAAERGIDPGDNTLSSLSAAVAKYNPDPKASDQSVQGDILTLYAKLAGATDHVNGRTLLDTERADSNLRTKFLVTLLLALLAISNEIMAIFFANMSDEFSGWMLYVVDFRAYVLEFLSPFLWGAVGACVYLLKNLYDIAAERKFDLRMQHGWYMRVLLGAIMAGVVYYLFGFTGVVEGGKEASGKAVAFLVGVGVKVVYGGLERLIVLIADKLDLTQVRRIQVNPSLPTPPADTKKK